MEKKDERKQIYALIVIMVVAVIVRCWRLTELPFMHDELSMMSRLVYDNWGELIAKGVKPDGHPAGVQVLMWLYTRNVGTAEWMVKLPFIVMGVGSVAMTYVVGRQWMSAQTGLLAAAFVATTQFCITTGSQIARPYASGLFLSLCMVYFWSWIVWEKKNKPLYFVLYALFGAMCAYNHYFSLMFAGIVWLTGWFFLDAKLRKGYLGAGVGMIALFAPHFSIFQAQLQTGGLSWLGEIHPTFFGYYVGYIFHFSIAVAVLMGLICALQLYFVFTQAHIQVFTQFSTKVKVAIVWFLLPMCVGYLYSVWRAPVLQASMLIFSLPFLFFVLFAYAHRLPLGYIFPLSGMIMTLNLLTLFYQRAHFETSYRQPFKQIHLKGKEMQKQYGKDAAVWVGANPYFVAYYDRFSQDTLAFTSFYENLPPLPQFKQRLDSLPAQFLTIGYLPPTYLNVARAVFPYVLWIDKGYTYELYGLARSKPAKSLNEKIYYQIDWDTHTPKPSGIEADTMEVVWDAKRNRHCYLLDSAWNRYPKWQALLSSCAPDKHVFVDAEVEIVFPDSLTKGCLIVSVEKNGKPLAWECMETSNAISLGENHYRLFLSHRLTPDFEHTSIEDAHVTVIYQHQENTPIALTAFRVKIREGNRFVYAMLYDF